MDKIKEKFQNINRYHVLAAVFGVSVIGAACYFIRKGKKKNDSGNDGVSPPTVLAETPPEVGNLPDSEEKALVRLINKLKKVLADK
jgi:hypothetical protein